MIAKAEKPIVRDVNITLSAREFARVIGAVEMRLKRPGMPEGPEEYAYLTRTLEHLYAIRTAYFETET